MYMENEPGHLILIRDWLDNEYFKRGRWCLLRKIKPLGGRTGGMGSRVKVKWSKYTTVNFIKISTQFCSQMVTVTLFKS